MRARRRRRADSVSRGSMSAPPPVHFRPTGRWAEEDQRRAGRRRNGFRSGTGRTQPPRSRWQTAESDGTTGRLAGSDGPVRRQGRTAATTRLTTAGGRAGSTRRSVVRLCWPLSMTSGLCFRPSARPLSSVGQSCGLLIRRSWVRAPQGVPRRPRPRKGPGPYSCPGRRPPAPTYHLRNELAQTSPG